MPSYGNNNPNSPKKAVEPMAKAETGSPAHSAANKAT